MDISSRTSRGSERLRLAIFLAIIAHLADIWIGTKYKKIYTYMYLAHQFRYRTDNDSPTSAVLISLLSITTIRKYPGNFTAFFGVDLCFDVVFASLIRHLDLATTFEEFRGELINGPVATCLYILTTYILRNGFSLQFLRTCLSAFVPSSSNFQFSRAGLPVVIPSGISFQFLRPYLTFITPSRVKIVTKIVVFALCRKLMGTRRRRNPLGKYVWETITLSVVLLAWLAKWIIWGVHELSYIFLIKPAWLVLQFLLRGIDNLKGSLQWLNRWGNGRMHILKMLQPPNPDFEYNHLATPRKIRLLKILRRRPFSEVRCELIEVDLDDPPPFEAISYTWRDETFNTPILVDGCHFKITPAVQEILEYRQSFAGSRLMWIDAICINQNDNDDKNRQVQLMRDIYRQASRVIIWLGPQNQAQDASEFSWMLLRLAASKTFRWYSFRETIRRNDPGWVALANLLRHPWFERVWIIQEVAMGRPVHVIYGNVCFKWDTIALGVTELMDTFTQMHAGGLDNQSVSAQVMDKRDHLSNIGVITRFQSAVRNNELPTLENALMDCTKFLSGDPRDKVFALLAMSDEHDGRNLRPDYEKPTASVYLEVMCHLLSRNNRMPPKYRAIELAGIGFPRAKELEQVLPSWVVDWSSTNQGQIITNDVASFNLMRQSGTPAVLSTNPQILMLTGDQYDVLSVLGKKNFISPTFGTGLKDCINWYREAKLLAQERCRLRFADGESFQNAFWSILTGSSNQQQNEGSRALREFESLIETTTAYEASRVELQVRDTNKLEELLILVLGRRCHGKMFSITENGRMGLVPPRSRIGDLVCQINGVRPPLLLRKWKKSGSKTPQYHGLVGACHLKGLDDHNGFQMYLIK